MEACAKAKFQRYGSRRVNLVLDQIRGKNVQAAEEVLPFVAKRMPNISQFATKHDLILFVCGRKSSNGKVLYNECLRVNPNTHLIEGPEEIDPQWLVGVQTVGICGATSTPKWLMEQCRDKIAG